MFGIDDAIGAGAGLLGGILGEVFGNQKRNKASNAWNDYINQANNQMSLDPQKALEFLGLTDQTAYDQMDPRSKEASMQAIQQLIKRGSGTGMDVQSRQALGEAQNQAGNASRAARQAVMQEYQQRGAGGSGAELAGALQGNQAAYSDLAGASGQAAAASEQRRLEANVLASRAGQQQQQLEQQKAAATDALRRFNVGARQDLLSQQQSAMKNLGYGYGGLAGVYSGQAPQMQDMGSNMGWYGRAAAKFGGQLGRGGVPANAEDPTQNWDKYGEGTASKGSPW